MYIYVHTMSSYICVCNTQIEVPLSLVSQGPNDTLRLSVELIWR